MSPDAIMAFLALLTVATILLTFTAASFTFSKMWNSINKPRWKRQNQCADDFFLTARNAGTSWLSACAWCSAVCGAWLLPTCGFYGVAYGIVGMLYYSTTLALEILVMASVARIAYRHIPQNTSLPSSIRQIYGRTTELYLLSFMILSEFTCLASEFIAVATVFNEIVNLPKPVTFAVYGAVGAFYTFFGGALVGLFTAQFHAVLGTVCLVVLIPYFINVAHHSPPTTSYMLFGADRKLTLATLYGSPYQNFLFALVYSSFWQKCICTNIKKTGLASAAGGGLAVACAAAFWGAAGAAVAWKDYATQNPNPYYGSANLQYLDPALAGKTSIHDSFEPYSYWFGILVMVYAAVTSKAAVESWVDGLLCGVYGSLDVSKHGLLAARAVVMCIVGLAIYIAHINLNILGLYTIANVCCASLAFPLFLSICNRTLLRIATPAIIISSSLCGLAACCAYGIGRTAATAPSPLPPHLLLKSGLKLAFYSNNYAWEYILLSLCTPLLVYIVLMAARVWRLRCNEAQFAQQHLEVRLRRGPVQLSRRRVTRAP